MSMPFQLSIGRILRAMAWLLLAIAAGRWCVNSLGGSFHVTFLAFVIAFGCVGSSVASLEGRGLQSIAGHWAYVACIMAEATCLPFALHAIIP
jgi:hypothetical protein